MNKTLALSAALALAALSPATQAAQAPGGFLRAELGNSDIDLSFDGMRASDSDTSAVFGGGYWFNANFAVEGHIGVLYNTALGYGEELDLVTAGVGAVGKKNFGADGLGFFVGGRAGVARMTAQVREDDYVVIDNAHSTKPYFGVSAGYDFTPRFGLSLNFDRRSGEFDGIDVDVDTIAVGGEFRF